MKEQEQILLLHVWISDSVRENAFHAAALHVNDAHLHLLNNTPNADSHLAWRDSMQHTTVRRHIIWAPSASPLPASPPARQAGRRTEWSRIKQHEKRCAAAAAAAPGDLPPLPAGWRASGFFFFSLGEQNSRCRSQIKSIKRVCYNFARSSRPERVVSGDNRQSRERRKTA